MKIKKIGLLVLIAMLGCGDSGSVPQVQSDFLGVYRIDRYAGDAMTCSEPLADLPQLVGDPQFVSIYSFYLSKDNGPFIGIQFCQDVEFCSSLAKDATQPIGPGTWVFIEGDDQNGWTGFAAEPIMEMGETCVLRAQVHTLTRAGDALSIVTETKTSSPFGTAPDLITGEVKCTVAQGLLVLDGECEAIITLDATFEASFL